MKNHDLIAERLLHLAIYLSILVWAVFWAGLAWGGETYTYETPSGFQVEIPAQYPKPWPKEELVFRNVVDLGNGLYGLYYEHQSDIVSPDMPALSEGVMVFPEPRLAALIYIDALNERLLMFEVEDGKAIFYKERPVEINPGFRKTVF